MMTLPARTIFFRSISSPIMNSMKIRPSSAMVRIDSWDLTQLQPGRTEQEAGDQVGQHQRLAQKVRRHAKEPRRHDRKCEVLDQLVHSSPLARRRRVDNNAAAAVVFAGGHGLSLGREAARDTIFLSEEGRGEWPMWRSTGALP